MVHQFAALQASGAHGGDCHSTEIDRFRQGLVALCRLQHVEDASEEENLRTLYVELAETTSIYALFMVCRKRERKKQEKKQDNSGFLHALLSFPETSLPAAPAEPLSSKLRTAKALEHRKSSTVRALGWGYVGVTHRIAWKFADLSLFNNASWRGDYVLDMTIATFNMPKK